MEARRMAGQNSAAWADAKKVAALELEAKRYDEFEDDEDDENENSGNIGNNQVARAADKLAARKASSRRAVRGGKSPGLSRSPLASSSRPKTPPPLSTRPRRQREEPEAQVARAEQETPRVVVAAPEVSVVNTTEKRGSTRSRSPANACSPACSPATSSPATSSTVPLYRNSSVLIILAEALLLILSVLFVTPSQHAPHSTSKPFFHTVQQNEPFSFEIEVSAWPQPEFQWRLNGVDIPGQTDKKLTVGSAQLTNSGTYTCLVENKAGRFVWEEGYVNVIASKPAEPGMAVAFSSTHVGSDSETVRSARMCLLKRAPEAVLRSASVDGGAAVIAAGEAAGYLDCFDGLKLQMQQEAGRASKINGSDAASRRSRALGLLRSMHGASSQRNLLVNVVSALDDLALLTMNRSPDSDVNDAKARVAFEAGLFCASTPQCAGDTSGNARQRVVSLVMNALGGADSEKQLL